MGEPLLIIGVFVSLSMLLPLAFPCTPTNCYIKQGETVPYCPEGTSTNIRCFELHRPVPCCFFALVLLSSALLREWCSAVLQLWWKHVLMELTVGLHCRWTCGTSLPSLYW